MRKFLILMTAFCLCQVAIAAERRTLPQPIQLHTNTTDQADSIYLKFLFHDANPRAELKYNIVDQNGDYIRTHKIVVRNNDATQCTEAGKPFTCCTDAGVGDCDEFNDLVAPGSGNIGAILQGRSDSIMWKDVKRHYPLAQ